MNEDNKEALNNLINSIQEKMNTNTSESNEIKENTTPSFDISSLLNTLNSSTSSSNSSNDESSNESNGFDPNLLLKFQKIMGAINSSNPQKDLLLSLKPFLRKSRQNKINEYLTILSLISVLDSFKDKGSD